MPDAVPPPEGVKLAGMGKRTEYFRLYKQQQRADAKAKGLCIICCTNKPRKGNVTCDDCQQRANEAKKEQ